MISLDEISFKRPAPRSAVVSRPSGANEFAPLSRARLAQILAPGYCPKLKFLDKLIREQKTFDARHSETEAQSAELSKLITAIQTKAAAEEWSQREFCARLGIAPRAWRRLCARQVNAAEWLPRLRRATAYSMQATTDGRAVAAAPPQLSTFNSQLPRG